MRNHADTPTTGAARVRRERRRLQEDRAGVVRNEGPSNSWSARKKRRRRANQRRQYGVLALDDQEESNELALDDQEESNESAHPDGHEARGA